MHDCTTGSPVALAVDVPWLSTVNDGMHILYLHMAEYEIATMEFGLGVKAVRR